MAQADPPSGPFAFGPFLLDPAARELTRDGEAVVLPARAFDCLQYLVLHRERAVGRDELAQAVFGRGNVSDAQIGQIVLRARRAVDDDGQAQNAIRTVPRYGFRWVAQTRVLAPAPARPPQAVAAAPDAPRAPVAVAGDPAPAPQTGAVPGGVREPVPQGPAFAQRVTLAALALLLVGAVLAWWWLRPTAGQQQAPSVQSTLVLPTEVAGAEVPWARPGLMDFIADRLRRVGMAVPPSESTLAMLGDATGVPLRDAQRQVRSTAERRGQVWRVRLEAIAADRTRTSASADDAELLAAAARATDRLLAALGQR